MKLTDQITDLLGTTKGDKKPSVAIREAEREGRLDARSVISILVILADYIDENIKPK